MQCTNMNHNISTHTPERLLLQWHITDRCNLFCSHCYQEASPSAEPSFDELLLILEQFKEFIHRCREQSGSRRFKAHITVTGGEPFIREDFIALLERLAADSHLFSFAILTNGTLLTPAIVQSLIRLKPGFVQVSIDGAKETQDLRNENYTAEAMREFLRDMIANLNGMYHVMALNPDLLYSKEQVP